ncbi:MAG: hypothetical protein ACK4WD_10645 [Flavobacteriales bacterium]|jgi:hypothetical protein
MIYDYLFFKSYQLGKRSRNFEDIPVLAGVIWVGACFMFNIYTIAMLAEALGYSGGFVFEKKYKYIFSLGLVLLLIFYYSYKGRYKTIIERYEEKERMKGKGIHPVLVITFYYVASFLIGMLTAMFKNGDGVFK